MQWKNGTEYHYLFECENPVKKQEIWINVQLLHCKLIKAQNERYILQYKSFKQSLCIYMKTIWRYQRGNQNPLIDERQTKLFPKEKVQSDNDLQTTTQKSKYWGTRTPLKPNCSGRISSSCLTSSTRRLFLVTNLVTSP
jgi:hypothetical protein